MAPLPVAIIQYNFCTVLYLLIYTTVVSSNFQYYLSHAHVFLFLGKIRKAHKYPSGWLALFGSDLRLGSGTACGTSLIIVTKL